MADRNQLRRELRRRRRELSPLDQKRAALRLARQLLRMPAVQRARHIAVYLPNDGEIDPGFFVALAQRLGKVCYLPVLHPVLTNRLWFCRFDRNIPMHHNRFGIPEPRRPRAGQKRPPWAMQLVLLPLVGFDAGGGRLGMGGGFYDRTFAFTRLHGGPRPRLIGLAHALQEVEKLPVAHWDIPLEAVVTDAAVHQGETPVWPVIRDENAMAGRYRLRQRLTRQISTHSIRRLQKRLDAEPAYPDL